MGRPAPAGLLSGAGVSGAGPAALLAVAEAAAWAAAEGLLARFASGAGAVHAKSSATDLVSEADLEAEQRIRTALQAARPDDAILAEEGEDRPGSTGLRWVVDPLDGTTNFLFGIPQWAVSVAVEDAEGTIAGVVVDPVRGEAFSATRGGPAARDGAPVRGSGRADLATALVATGFAYDPAVRARQGEVVTALLPHVRDVRRMGSAALDLAWTACGRYDAYYERGLQPWDAAAGALCCACAGLEVRRLPPAGGMPDGLLAAPGALVEPLLELVAPQKPLR